MNDAIDQIQNEADDFADELEGVEFQYPGFQGKRIIDIFESLHNNEIVLKPYEARFRKGKPDFRNPMLRLYGIELEENCIVITGGAIKLTRQMDRPHLQKEIKRLKRVQDFLNSQQIYSKEALE